MKGLAAAWALGEGLVVWREVHKEHHLPVPGKLLAVTGLFAGLALVADVYPTSARLVTAVAWGLDIAGFLSLFGQGLGTQIGQAAASQQAGGA